MAVLQIDDLVVRYGAVIALDGLSLTLSAGELLLLLGPNGAGKSSLLKCIVGLKRQESGSIRFDGTDLSNLPAHQRARLGIAWSPEGRGVIPALSVEDNLDLARLACADWDQGLREQTFARFPVLRKALHRPAGSLSGGEQQMLTIARALETRPKLLLVDEPSLGLAPRIAAEVMDLLAEIARQGYSTVVVEQRTAAIMEVCDRVLMLRMGRVHDSKEAARFADINFNTYLGATEENPCD